MKIAVACGGTGGHIFPGLATAEVLRRRGHTITLWLAGKGVESAAASGWDGPVITVSSEGFETRLSWRALGTVWRLFQAVRTCTRIMRVEAPDVLLAMGSYASVGPVGAALRCKVPVVLHESNVVPGRAVRLLARWATAVAVSFEETRYHLRGRDLVVTGMPLRRELEEAARQAAEDRPRTGPPTVLVMGGSGGARSLNDAAPAGLAEAQRQGCALKAIHLTGRGDEERVAAAYRALGLPAVVHGFTHDMAGLYRQADLAISRSGAASCAELSAFGIPSLLVPYPHAVGDHQAANARSLEKAGAADVVADADLTSSWLASYLVERLGNAGRLRAMGLAARGRLRASGADPLADLVLACGANAHGRSAHA